MYDWKDLANRFIESEGLDFRIKITASIISATRIGLDHNDLWHYIKPLLLNMFEKYGRKIWPDFGIAISNAHSMESCWLREPLERENSISINQPNLFNVVPFDLVVEWCKSAPDGVCSVMRRRTARRANKSTYSRAIGTFW